MHTFGRSPVEFVEGHGMKLTGDDGREYLDFLAGIGVCSLGHGDPAVLSALEAQTKKLMHVSNYFYIERLLDSEYIPVIATVAAGEDGGFFNINADTAAGAVAAALHAHKAIFLTDVDGLYKDFSDKDSLISNLTLDEVNEMLYGGEVDKGMIPKLRAAVDALTAGVFRAHIINGTTPHSLLLELLTDAGVGTVIHSTETAYEFDTHPHPLSTFAARLTENLDEVEKLQTV